MALTTDLQTWLSTVPALQIAQGFVAWATSSSADTTALVKDSTKVAEGSAPGASFDLWGLIQKLTTSLADGVAFLEVLFLATPLDAAALGAPPSSVRALTAGLQALLHTLGAESVRPTGVLDGETATALAAAVGKTLADTLALSYATLYLDVVTLRQSLPKPSSAGSAAVPKVGGWSGLAVFLSLLAGGAAGAGGTYVVKRLRARPGRRAH